PTFPFQFANQLGDKIALWNNNGVSYGLGIQGGLLQIHTSGSSEDITFGYGSSAAMVERMRIKGNGNVGIGIDPSSKLHVSGGDFQLNGGSIYVDNGSVMYAKNAAGTWEPFLWPRWVDNASYFNYSSGGFNIRNKDSGVTMFMHPNGNVGIGSNNTTPARK